ncbi:hypothetical protein E2562_011966 [Oryza meyeriana var. granulata]|uniref:Uncharacterized protein n=1 Tax=Oryza meyeriana var. granulata TaxID=110450 RepID=A0A6G1F6W5_9ORYZ|nr:hypothetical protein E2562_011966 [Oryza meyeriana var. granulata]
MTLLGPTVVAVFRRSSKQGEGGADSALRWGAQGLGSLTLALIGLSRRVVARGEDGVGGGVAGNGRGLQGGFMMTTRRKGERGCPAAV